MARRRPDRGVVIEKACKMSFSTSHIPCRWCGFGCNKSTQAGFELSQWHTEYQDQRDADSLRAQTSLVYKFQAGMLSR